jgi:hypothetical protein
MTGAYLIEIYDASLNACNDFIREFCHHVRILYGSALAERMEYLSLDERHKRLIGMLQQLGNEDFLATLDGMTSYRLMNVDLESLLRCFEIDCSAAIELCTQDGGLDLHDVCKSVAYVYGNGWCLAFQQLVTCLTRSGKSLPEALEEILTHKHGLYFEWGRVAADLEAKLNLPRTTMWDFIDTPTNAPDRKVSFPFFFVVSACCYSSYVLLLTNMYCELNCRLKRRQLLVVTEDKGVDFLAAM